MPSCGQSVNLWLWRCCLFVLFLHGTLTSPWLRSDHLMIIWGLILTLVWIISLLSLVWHAGAAAGVVEVGNLTHLCAFQPGGEVAVAPSLLYIPAGRLKPPTVPRRGLPSPAPNTAFACISLSFSLSLSLSLSLSNHFYYHSTLSTALLCQVWESWRGFHLLLIICGQIGNCILSSLDDKMLPRSSPVFALV